ncbi:hypothetical protein HK101_007043 [Irineochytrium annulatum]|nr:hypothetical protein HK101_007043 [Irineochytrium annulatum]
MPSAPTSPASSTTNTSPETDPEDIAFFLSIIVREAEGERPLKFNLTDLLSSHLNDAPSLFDATEEAIYDAELLKAAAMVLLDLRAGRGESEAVGTALTEPAGNTHSTHQQLQKSEIVSSPPPAVASLPPLMALPSPARAFPACPPLMGGLPRNANLAQCLETDDTNRAVTMGDLSVSPLEMLRSEVATMADALVPVEGDEAEAEHLTVAAVNDEVVIKKEKAEDILRREEIGRRRSVEPAVVPFKREPAAHENDVTVEMLLQAGDDANLWTSMFPDILTRAPEFRPSMPSVTAIPAPSGHQQMAPPPQPTIMPSFLCSSQGFRSPDQPPRLSFHQPNPYQAGNQLNPFQTPDTFCQPQRAQQYGPAMYSRIPYPAFPMPPKVPFQPTSQQGWNMQPMWYPLNAMYPLNTMRDPSNSMPLLPSAMQAPWSLDAPASELPTKPLSPFSTPNIPGVNVRQSAAAEHAGAEQATPGVLVDSTGPTAFAQTLGKTAFASTKGEPIGPQSASAKSSGKTATRVRKQASASAATLAVSVKREPASAIKVPATEAPATLAAAPFKKQRKRNGAPLNKKRWRNAWMFFNSDFAAKKTGTEECTPSAAWAAMSEAEKAPFRKMAEDDRKRWDEEEAENAKKVKSAAASASDADNTSTAVAAAEGGEQGDALDYASLSGALLASGPSRGASVGFPSTPAASVEMNEDVQMVDASNAAMPEVGAQNESGGAIGQGGHGVLRSLVAMKAEEMSFMDLLMGDVEVPLAL